MGVSGSDHASQQIKATASDDAAAIARSVRSVVVLCGAVRRTPLARSVGRSLVDLPLADGTTLAEQHIAGAVAYADRFGVEGLSVRFLVDTDSVPPREHEGVGRVRCTVERDASPIRGVAGILADATRSAESDDYIVVVNGAQYFFRPLDELIELMIRKQADVSMVASADGLPVGLWLIRCGVLRTVREVGYIDLKEQALPDWLGRWKVSVVEVQRAYAARSRNLPEYLGVVRMQSQGVRAGSSVDEDPYREEWERSFSVIERGAEVGEGATVHDSVVLAGAKVGRGAVVVRSVVCPGATVPANTRCVARVFANGRGGGDE